MSEYEKALEDIYPLTVITDRYNGIYSGGKFTAFNKLYYMIPEGPDGSDVDCSFFWAATEGENNDYYEYDNVKDLLPIGKGNTPKEAILNLYDKLKKENKVKIYYD